VCKNLSDLTDAGCVRSDLTDAGCVTKKCKNSMYNSCITFLLPEESRRVLLKLLFKSLFT